MHRNARKALGVALAAILISSCSNSGDSASPTATVPRGTTSTTDPYAVPTTIDIPYLNRVFLALEKINGDATRLIVANRRITPEAAKLLDAIYTAEEFEVQADIWSDEVTKGLADYPQNPGDRKTQVTKIVVSRRGCVGVEAMRDYNALRTSPIDPSTAEITLVNESRSEINPTGWAIAEELKRGAHYCE